MWTSVIQYKKELALTQGFSLEEGTPGPGSTPTGRTWPSRVELAVSTSTNAAQVPWLCRRSLTLHSAYRQEMGKEPSLAAEDLTSHIAPGPRSRRWQKGSKKYPWAMGARPHVTKISCTILASIICRNEKGTRRKLTRMRKGNERRKLYYKTIWNGDHSNFKRKRQAIFKITKKSSGVMWMVVILTILRKNIWECL